MKMIMPRQFTPDWPLRINKITGAIVCLAIGIELSVMAFLRVLQPAVIATLGQICCCILLALPVNAYFNSTSGDSLSDS